MSILIPTGIGGGTATLPRQTQTANTAIVDIFQAPTGPSNRLKCSQITWENAGTVNNLAIVSALSRVKVYADVAAGATSIVLTKDPGNYSANFPATRPPQASNNLIAANDFIAYRTPSGSWVLVKPSAVSTDATTGRVTLTVPAVATGGIKANADVVFFGVAGDTSPLTGKSNQTVLVGVASTVTNYGGDGRILGQSELPDAPLMVYSANATAACTLHGGTAFAAP